MIVEKTHLPIPRLHQFSFVWKEKRKQKMKRESEGGKGKDPRVADDETFVSDSQIPLSFPTFHFPLLKTTHHQPALKKTSLAGKAGRL